MGETVAFASNGSTCMGYLATPATPGPGVIVIQEWWGLVPHIVNLVDRFAAAGFVALAPDFYRGEATTEPDEAQKHMLGLQVSRAAADIKGAAEFLVGRDDVTSGSVGTVGFCMGGGLALLGGTASELITSAVAFYPATPWPDYHPDWSQYAGKHLTVHKAESDEPHAGPMIAALRSDIEQAGGRVDIFDYPGSMHAFFNDDRPEVYAADHSASAWERTLAVFRSDLA